MCVENLITEYLAAYIFHHRKFDKRKFLAILDGVSVALGEAETSDRNAVVMRNAIPIPKRKPQKVVLSEITPHYHIRNYPSKSIVRAHSRPEW